MPEIVTSGIVPAAWFLENYLIETNGTVEPGTIVVGSTPFQRSACTSMTRLGLLPSALPRASIAAASASPVTRMLAALAFAVQPHGVRIGLRLGADGVGLGGRLGHCDLRLHLFALGVLLELLHL